MRKTASALWFGLAAVGGVIVASSGMADSYKGYEQPPYTVAQAEGAYELRDYGTHTVAEVQITGSRDGAVGKGFRVLAGYIFGGNDQGTKIAMTVPVAQTPVAGDAWTIRFMMPADVAQTLPAPRDASIRFVTVPPERQVTLTFSGLRGDGVLTERATALRSWADAQGLTITTGPHYYFYDGPMTLPWNRRNEVAFTVE